MNFYFSNNKVYFWGPLSPLYPEKSPFLTTETFSVYLNIYVNSLSDLPPSVTSQGHEILHHSSSQAGRRGWSFTYRTCSTAPPLHSGHCGNLAPKAMLGCQK